MQTLAASLAKRNFSWGWRDSEASYLELNDGSMVRSDCIWHTNDAPVLVVVHGIGGSSLSTYMQGLSHKAYREGWNAVLLNLYNCNSELRHPKIFHAGASSELGELLNLLITRRQIKVLFLAGISMGANILLKLMGEWGTHFPPSVRAAAVISPLVDLPNSWDILEKPCNLIFQRHFIKNLKRRIHKNRQHLNAHVDVSALMRIRTIRQFDELFTAPLGGFENAVEYYKQASALPHLKNICIPTLLLHARDDPLLPWLPFTLPEVKQNSALLISLNRRGGHTGFIERDGYGDIDRRWAENRSVDFFRVMRGKLTA